jgi:TRAP-type mannitol/chloroaromatic compound transport system permease small subunit
VKAISKINEVIAKYASLILLVMMAVLICDVTVRALFTKTLFFSYDLSWMLNGAFFILGAGYTLLKDGHTRVDTISRLFPPKAKNINSICYYLIIFFPFMIFMTIASSKYAYHAFITGESSPFTSWRPVLWPIRAILAVGIILLLLQGIVDFIHLIKDMKKEVKIQ